MPSYVKNVFLMIMGVVIAVILYFIFFGWGTGTVDGLFRNNATMSTVVSGETYQTDGEWRGLIYYAGEALETNISGYYYNYGYLPVAHRTDDVDSLIGMTNSDVSASGGLRTTCLLRPAVVEYLNTSYHATHGGTGAHGILSNAVLGTWHKTEGMGSSVAFSVVAK